MARVTEYFSHVPSPSNHDPPARCLVVVFTFFLLICMLELT